MPDYAIKKTVMVCDDEPDLLGLFGTALKSKYNVILVSSGEGCIDKFIEEKNRGNKIHLLVLDYRLGDMFGDTVARKMKEYNGLKISLLSVLYLDHALIKELQENDYVSKCIQKPVHLTDLVDIVTDTIN